MNFSPMYPESITYIFDINNFFLRFLALIKMVSTGGKEPVMGRDRPLLAVAQLLVSKE